MAAGSSTGRYARLFSPSRKTLIEPSSDCASSTSRSIEPRICSMPSRVCAVISAISVIDCEIISAALACRVAVSFISPIALAMRFVTMSTAPSAAPACAARSDCTTTCCVLCSMATTTAWVSI